MIKYRLFQKVDNINAFTYYFLGYKEENSTVQYHIVPIPIYSENDTNYDSIEIVPLAKDIHGNICKVAIVSKKRTLFTVSLLTSCLCIKCNDAENIFMIEYGNKYMTILVGTHNAKITYPNNKKIEYVLSDHIGTSTFKNIYTLL